MKKFAKILAVCMLVIMVAMTFTSCGIFSLNLDKVEQRLEKKDYETREVTDDYFLEEMASYRDIPTPKCAFEAVNEDEHFFEAMEFDSVKDAKEALAAMEDDLKEAAEYADDGYEMTWGRKGKVIYAGTVTAVKDALGFPANLFVKAK